MNISWIKIEIGRINLPFSKTRGHFPPKVIVGFSIRGPRTHGMMAAHALQVLKMLHVNGEQFFLTACTLVLLEIKPFFRWCGYFSHMQVPQWCSLTLGIVWLLQKFSNGALSLPESCDCFENFPMVLSHSRNRVAAPKIFQWCSLTPRIVWLLRKFSNCALSLPESCGCSKNFPMVISHSRNRVAAPKIFQWCSLIPGIVWLLQKFSNGALSLPESCGCFENFPMVLSHSP